MKHPLLVLSKDTADTIIGKLKVYERRGTTFSIKMEAFDVNRLTPNIYPPNIHRAYSINNKTDGLIENPEWEPTMQIGKDYVWNAYWNKVTAFPDTSIRITPAGNEEEYCIENKHILNIWPDELITKQNKLSYGILLSVGDMIKFTENGFVITFQYGNDTDIYDTLRYFVKVTYKETKPKGGKNNGR